MKEQENFPQEADVNQSEVESPNSDLGLGSYREENTGGDAPVDSILSPTFEINSEENVREELSSIRINTANEHAEESTSRYNPQEPITHKQNKIPLKVKIAGVTAAGVAMIGGLIGADKMRSNSEDADMSTGTVTSAEGSQNSNNTHIPGVAKDGGVNQNQEVASETPNSTPTLTVEATHTSEPTLTPEPTPTIESHPGLYRSLEEAPFSEEDKATILELLNGAEIEIITDEVIIAKEPELKERTSCPATYMSEATRPCPSMSDIFLVYDDYDNPVERLNDFGKLQKWHIWQRNHPDSSLTREEYEAQITEENYDSQVFVRNTETGRMEMQPLRKDTPSINIFRAQPSEDDYIIHTTDIQMHYKAKNGILASSLYSTDPVGSGTKYPDIQLVGSLASMGLFISTEEYVDRGLSGEEPVVQGIYSPSHGDEYMEKLYEYADILQPGLSMTTPEVPAIIRAKN